MGTDYFAHQWILTSTLGYYLEIVILLTLVLDDTLTVFEDIKISFS